MNKNTNTTSEQMKTWKPLTRGNFEYKIYGYHKGQDFPFASRELPASMTS